MAEYLTLEDGSKVLVVTKENSRLYMLPIGTVYVDKKYALCSGTKADKEGYIIAPKDEQYENDFLLYEDKLREAQDYEKQGYEIQMPIPPALPKFILDNLLAEGESVTASIIEPNEPDAKTKISTGFLKNKYKFSNNNGECVKELIESVPTTKEGYDYFIRTGQILPISQTTTKSSSDNDEKKNEIILPIIIGSAILIGIFFIILYMNKNKRGKRL